MKRLLQLTLLMSLLVIPMLGLNGCGGSKVVFVETSDGLVRLGSDVRGHIYVWNGSNWELSANKVNLPEGWFAGSVDVEATPNTVSAAR